MRGKGTVGLLGTGLMGTPIGGRLIQAGFDLLVWNRTQQKLSSLIDRGGRSAACPAEVAAGADALLLSLSDGLAVESVLMAAEMRHALRAGTLVIDASSIPPPLAREHAAELSAIGVHHLDAPVSGGPLGAAAGALSIMVGGAHADFDRATPIFDALGQSTLVGGHGAGQIAKLVNQLICGVAIEAVAEGLMLAQQAGCEPIRVRTALGGGFADSLVLEQHGARMLERDWRARGKARTHLKDSLTAAELASTVGLTLPLLESTLDLYRGLVEHGGGDLDHSAVLLELERRNSVAGPSPVA